MMLFKVIDGLFVGTRYGVWVMSLLGIVASALLFLLNIKMGMSAMMVFVATLSLSLCLSLLLAPAKFIQHKLKGNSYLVMGTLLAVIALAIMGVVYFTNQGFPPLNLIFQ